MLLVVLGAEVAARQDQDHRVAALQLAEAPSGAGVVGQLVVGEPSPGDDVTAHRMVLSLVRPSRRDGRCLFRRRPLEARADSAGLPPCNRRWSRRAAVLSVG
jgi:hypothetical protein